jgi:hypothetical protein
VACMHQLCKSSADQMSATLAFCHSRSGDTMNTASRCAGVLGNAAIRCGECHRCKQCHLLCYLICRMETTCKPGYIHASDVFARLLPNEEWDGTGGVEVKGIGNMQTFLHKPTAVTLPNVGPPPPEQGDRVTRASAMSVATEGADTMRASSSALLARMASMSSSVRMLSHSPGPDSSPLASRSNGLTASPLATILANLVGGDDEDGADLTASRQRLHHPPGAHSHARQSRACRGVPTSGRDDSEAAEHYYTSAHGNAPSGKHRRPSEAASSPTFLDRHGSVAVRGQSRRASSLAMQSHPSYTLGASSRPRQALASQHSEGMPAYTDSDTKQPEARVQVPSMGGVTANSSHIPSLRNPASAARLASTNSVAWDV